VPALKKVLHLIKDYSGNNPLFNEYVKALPRDSCYSIVCYMSGSPDNKNRMEEAASEVLYLGFPKKELRRLHYGVLLALTGIIREKGVEVIYCQRHKATVLGVIAAMLSGVETVVSHVHGLDRARSFQRRFTNWLLFRRVKKIIAVSESVRRDVLGSNWRLDPAKVITVLNGIDFSLIDGVSLSRQEIRSRWGIEHDAFVFGTVGRLTETKGHACLLDAFASISGDMPQARLILVGDGKLRGKLEQKAGTLGVSSRVIFTGYREDAHALLRGFDIFVFPSLAEGLGVALIEAMASGLPVIASDVGGIPEVTGSVNCGRLVPPGDQASLASAMQEIARQDIEQRRVLGENGRTHVMKEFTTESMSKKIAEVFRMLTGKP
jgi:glycosyltransferase involved in cell wall biosynthesis